MKKNVRDCKTFWTDRLKLENVLQKVQIDLCTFFWDNSYRVEMDMGASFQKSIRFSITYQGEQDKSFDGFCYDKHFAKNFKLFQN